MTAARLRRAACAAVLALAPPATAAGGPVEAREAWTRAQALRTGPARARLRALRDARTEAPGSDPLVARIAAAEARALDGMGSGAAARAAEALAADAGPSRDPARLARVLAAARSLEADGDLVGANDRLDEVLASSSSGASEVRGPALVLATRLAAERTDARALARFVREAGALPPDRVGDRLLVVDLAGEVRRRAGDLEGARRALDEATRVYADAVRRGDPIARLASRAWLRLTLPKVLDVR